MVATMSRACSRGLVFDLARSAAILGRSRGVAEMSSLACARSLALAAGVLALTFGGVSRVFRMRGKKIWARERMVGRRAPGCSVRRTKWQKSRGSSKVFRKAFWAASFMASAGVMTKKRSRVSRLLVSSRNSRICSTEIRRVVFDSSG